MENNIIDSKTKSIQKYGLKILCELHNICEANNLKYILDYGTLLGAVRHGGYIPWDDDIDVAMPREDFEKFKEISSKQLPEDMILQTHESQENYYMPFPKIIIDDGEYTEERVAHFDITHGPWMDIFIYDYKYDNKEKELERQRNYNKKRKFYSYIAPNIISSSLPNQSIIKTFVKKIVISAIEKSQTKNPRGIIMKYLDYKYSELERFLEQSPENNISGEMMTYSFGINSVNPEESLSLNIKDFEDRKLVKFEEQYFYIPDNYEEILANRYGDYKKLPPKEERKSNHIWVN